MARLWWLVLPALLVVIVLTLPAALVAARLDLPAQLGQIRGSLWSGQARWQQPGHRPMQLNWRWEGGARWRWTARADDTELAGTWRPGEVLVLPSLGGQLALARLDLSAWLVVARPTGFLELDLSGVELASGAVPQAHGQAVWRQAGLVGAVQESLGDIGLTLVPAEDHLAVQVRSLQPAAVQVRGHIHLYAERYQAELWLRAASDRPDLTPALAQLGEVQPDGQVRLRIGGRTGW